MGFFYQLEVSWGSDWNCLRGTEHEAGQVIWVSGTQGSPQACLGEGQPHGEESVSCFFPKEGSLLRSSQGLLW